MKIKTPVTVGTYDDAGMICDADGSELFSVGQNEDTREMFPNQAELAEEVMNCINSYSALAMHSDKLQIQLTQKQHVIDRQTKLLEVGAKFRYHLNYLLNNRMSYSEVKEAEKQARVYLEENP